MDKLSFAAAVAQVGLPALPRTLLRADTQVAFEGPYIVKPRFGGSSIGIEVVDDLPTAKALLTAPAMADGAVVEPFLGDCRDLQIAVRTHPKTELSAIEEPVRSTGALYSYEQKYLAWGEGTGIARELPARIDPDLESEIRAAAMVVADLVGVRSCARIDFLERDGQYWVNEINTIPGSMAHYLWIDPPLSRAELFESIMTEVEQSRPRVFSTAGADGTALRNAGTGASTLG
jgi:D-alanine-D-alanine ligase